MRERWTAGVSSGCAALAAALIAAPAAPARTVFDPVPYVDDYSVTPSAVVYAQGRDDERLRVLLLPPGSGARPLTQLDAIDRIRPNRGDDADAYERIPEVAASPALISAAVQTYSVYFEGASDFKAEGPSAVYATTRTGPARRLESCAKAALRDVSVLGRAVAYMGTGCTPGGAIAVHDTASGRRSVVRPPDGRVFGYYTLAARYVAAVSFERRDIPSPTDPGQLEVYDWRSGERVQLLPTPYNFDLGDDATVFAQGRPERGDACEVDRMERYAPGDPTPHPFPARACFDGLVVAGERMLWSRRLSGGRADYVVTDTEGGHALRVLPPRPATREGHYPVYFDGTRAGYVRPRCDERETIVIDAVADLARSGPLALETCRILVGDVPRSVRVAPRGDFVLRFRCPRGCEGLVRLYDTERRRLLRFPNYYNSKFLRLDAVPPGGTPRVRFRLDKSYRKRLARRGRLRLRLRLESFQPDGRSLRSSAPLTVLASG